uniref:Uncharacterized protein n=1 Tax=Panagrolaimus sp. ES5 TaxID=591445 RepID=A0AC34G0A1_9BILA
MKLKEVCFLMTSFDEFILFTKFMNHNPHIMYGFTFSVGSLSKEEKLAIKNRVQEIIDIGLTEFPPTWIEFPGQTGKQEGGLILLRNEYYSRKKLLKTKAALSK